MKKDEKQTGLFGTETEIICNVITETLYLLESFCVNREFTQKLFNNCVESIKLPKFKTAGKKGQETVRTVEHRNYDTII